MARKMRTWNPGDAANSYIRCLLSDAGEILGGVTDEQWAETLEFFDHKCAYTGDVLLEGTIVKDHAIPINRTHCGLHLFGNVLPTSRAENEKKGRKHFREHIDAGIRLQKIEDFFDYTRYWDKVEALGDLSAYCSKQYDILTAMCRNNRAYLQRICGISDNPSPTISTAVDVAQPIDTVNVSQSTVLPIRLIPESERDFNRQLIQTKVAWITTEYADGRIETCPWDARRITESSNIIGNLRSRPQFRQREWQRRNIRCVTVSICNPAGDHASG